MTGFYFCFRQWYIVFIQSNLPYWNLAFNQPSHQYFNKTRLQDCKINSSVGERPAARGGTTRPDERKSLVSEYLSLIGNTTSEWICPRCFAARKTDLCATNHTLLLSGDNTISTTGSPVWNVQLLSQHFHVTAYLQISNPRIDLSSPDVGMT